MNADEEARSALNADEEARSALNADEEARSALNADGEAPIVSIVVVTYGTGPIVVEALDAIVRSTPTPHQVIVVDNPPDDGRPPTLQILAERTDVDVVVPPSNLGFAGGNELGVEHAQSELLCFLNPDVVVRPGWLEPLIAALDDPVVGIAAPILVAPDGSLQEAGQLLYRDACTAAVGGPEVMPGDWSNAFSRDVDYASAACWVVRRAEHLARGGFDRRYHPAYFEDVDYAVRVEQGGQRTRLVADVPVVHHHGLGGAGQNLALGEASQAVFRERWSDQLPTRPARPADAVEVIVNRDRLVERRLLTVAWSEQCTTGRWTAAFEDAIETAAAHPRDRVTFLTDRAPEPDAAQSAARAGLELIVSPAGSDRTFVEQRVLMADDVTTVRSPMHAVHRFGLLTAIAIAMIGLLGLAARWLVLRSPAGRLTADEAYTGIQSFEILGGQFPVVLGGTAYTLPFESYLYTPFAAAIGADVTLLKLLSTVSWAFAALVLGMIASRISNRRTAGIAAVLCWITPGALLIVSVTAYSAYASGMLVTVTVFLVASLVIDADPPSWWTAALFGLLAGFGFWLHPMFLATLVPMVLVVLWVHRRRLGTCITVVAGGLVGCGPLLLWNAVNEWPSLETPAQVEGTYLERLRTFAVDLLPRAFGLRDIDLEWQPDAVTGPVLYAGLLGAVIGGVVLVVRRPGPRSRVLLPAVLVGVFPIMAMFENLIFAADGRYGIISFPFLVLAASVSVDALIGRSSVLRAVGVAAVVAIVWVAGFVAPTLQPLVDDTDGDPNAPLEEIVDRLDEAGIDRVYGSYWAVHPVDFVGDRRLVGGVFPFWPVRFPDRQRTVEATPLDEVAVVFLVTDEDPSRLLLPPDSYVRTVHGDVVLYLPAAASVSGTG